MFNDTLERNMAHRGGQTKGASYSIRRRFIHLAPTLSGNNGEVEKDWGEKILRI